MEVGTPVLVFLILMVFLILCLSGLVLYSYSRFRSGHPAPSWRSCVPFASSCAGHRAADYPKPRSGGLIGWTKDQLSRLTNTRMHRGAYEDVGRGGRRVRGRYTSADHREDGWDAEVGLDTDTRYADAGGDASSRRYEEEQELGTISRSPYKRYYQASFEEKIDTPASDGCEDQLQRGSTATHASNVGKRLKDNVSTNPFDDQADDGRLRDMTPLPEPAKGASTKSVS